MAMQPLQSQWVNPPPTIATSAFSPGGAYYPTPLNNYNIAPPNSSYGNPYANANRMVPVQSQGQGGFGSIISNAQTLKSAGQFIGNGFQLPQSSFINSVGTGLGFAPGAVSYGSSFGPSVAGAAEAFGPAAADAGSLVAGSTGASATLSSTLGAAGIGALAGNFLGRIGGNATGGSIGGGIGAGIGMAVGGPVGGVIGGLIGGIGGGFFGGGKKPTAASHFNAVVDPNGAYAYTGYGAKNAGQYDGYNQQLSSDISSALQQAKQYLPGINYKNFSISGGVNTLHSGGPEAGYITLYNDSKTGTGWDTGTDINKSIYFNPDDPNDKQRAIGEAVAQLALRSGATPEQVQSMSQQIQFNSTPQGQASQSMPFVPIQNNQRFADYMAKYKDQGTPNAPTNPTT